MKIKTSEATPKQIDFLVAKCEGQDAVIDYGEVCVFKTVEFVEHKFLWKPSTNWAQGGPIIEREELSGLKCYGTNEWGCNNGDIFCEGPTPLIAAMRCYVTCKLGDEVEIPEELI